MGYWSKLRRALRWLDFAGNAECHTVWLGFTYFKTRNTYGKKTSGALF
jgi:hypothetical protein